MATKRSDKFLAEMLGEESVITPSELCNHELPKKFLGGYKTSETDALLARAADALESLSDQMKLLRESNLALNERLEEHREMESTLRGALMSSQKFSEEILDAARREAQAIVSEAEAQRAEIHLERSQLPDALRGEIRLLEEQRGRLERDLSAVLEAHGKMLEAARVSERGAIVELEGEKGDSPVAQDE